MFRHRLHVHIRYGHFKDYLALAEELNELGRSRGWAESTFWTPTVGAANELVVETDYPDLATFQRVNEAFSSDPEAMKLVRSGIEHVVEGSVHDQLIQQAPHIA